MLRAATARTFSEPSLHGAVTRPEHHSPVRRILLVGLVASLALPATAAALLTPGRTLTSAAPVTALSVTHRSVVFAVGRTRAGCGQVRLWDTGTRSLWSFGEHTIVGCEENPSGGYGIAQVAATGRRTWRQAEPAVVPLLVDAPDITTDTRAAVWRQALGTVDAELVDLAAAFRVAPERIPAAGRAAVLDAERPERVVVDARDQPRHAPRAEAQAGRCHRAGGRARAAGRLAVSRDHVHRQPTHPRSPPAR